MLAAMACGRHVERRATRARVDEALARDPELARQYAVIREEYAKPFTSTRAWAHRPRRAMQKLFDAIDGEPVRKPSVNVARRDADRRILSLACRRGPWPGPPVRRRWRCCCRPA